MLQERPHQTKARQDIQQALVKADRCTLVSAPGTGKTLIGFGAAEDINGKIVIVACPTLMLLAQTAKAWREYGHRATFIAAASADIADTALTTTDAGELAGAILDSPDNLVIFSTHASLPVVESALKTCDTEADLLIIDEAHRVAGEIDSELRQTALETLPAVKRLFMTATPRVSEPSDSGAVSAFSMSDPNHFGVIVDGMSFAEAISHDPPLLADYRIVAAATVRGDATEEELETALHGAAADAMARFGGRRALVFHWLIDQAEEFAARHPEAASLRGSEVSSWAVSSRNSQQERTELLNQFLACETRATLSNARLFSEGVDAPTVDTIVFTAPKESVVDIVQAAGRALRLDPDHPDKTATLVVPLVLDTQDPSVSPLVNVLLAMRDLDSRLADLLDTDLRERPGLLEIEWIGDPLSEELLARIRAEVVSHAAVEGRWFARLNRLKEFIIEHSGWPKRGQENAAWVSAQRQAFAEGRLSPLKIEALEAIGFDFTPQDSAWQAQYAILADSPDPTAATYPPELQTWVTEQRRAYKNKTLAHDRIAQLDALGFIWDPKTVAWHDWADRWQQGEKTPSTRGWISRQKQAAADGTLTDERRAILDELGVDLTIQRRRGSWDEMCAAMGAYFREHDRRPAKGDPLDVWLTNQIYRYRRGRLSDEQTIKFEALNWQAYTERQASFEDRIAEIEAFIDEHGERPKGRSSLARWISRQRSKARKGKALDRWKQIEAALADSGD